MPEPSSFISLPAFVLLIAANSAPVLLAQLLRERCAAPIDAGITLPDGYPLFGSHKTWRGLVAGTLVCGLLGTLLTVGFITGALFGLLALTGDLFSSFLKRRLKRPSGRWTPLLDQLPEALLPMMVLQNAMGLTASSIVANTIVFTLLDLVVSKRIG